MWPRRRSHLRRAQVTRFNLLLLEDGEYFLEDYSVLRYMEPTASTHRKVQGRLKVCTRGLFFVPNDIVLPIVRFPFRSIPELPHMTCLDGDDGLPCVSFRCETVVKMRERGIDHPYVQLTTTSSTGMSASEATTTTATTATTTVDGNTTSDEDDEEGGDTFLVDDDNDTPSDTFIFSLLYSKVDKFIESVQPIYDVATRPHCSLNKVEEEKLLAPVLAPRLKVDFDPSLLVDFREKFLLLPGRSANRIEPLLAYPGCLVLTNQRIYFQPANLNNVTDPILHWEFSEIEYLYKRRYLLRQIGLEIYTKGGDSFFFSFHSRKDRDDVYDLLVEQPSLARFERSNLEDMVHKWQRRELSTYDYLMFLNNAAGRTRNDLTQYPVFPWILQDYKSPSLDLNDPSVYRDLSKPIGALNKDRLEYFRTRYRVMPRGEDAEGMPPPFLYGTHYSTPGYVLYYLVRMAPQHMLCLQNGKFDSADRLFRSIQVTWEGCITNHSDVKELIPEFFNESISSADWLVNHHHLELGTTQNLERVDDVELPPWANGFPAEFVKKNREALESDYVSKHIHKWIDLIFGYKQQGSAAIAADNLFFYLSYEGAVDLDTVDDPVEKCSLESQIQEFGQTPRLLFSTPHPARDENKSRIEIATPDLLPSPRVRAPSTATKRQLVHPPTEKTHRGRDAIELNAFQSDAVARYGRQRARTRPKVNTQRGYLFWCVQESLIEVPRLIAGFLHQYIVGHDSGKPPKQWNWGSKLKYRRNPASYRWIWKQSVSQPLHSGEVTCTVLSKDNTTLYSTCKHSCFKVSSVANGSVSRSLRAKAALSCCDVSPDETRLLVGCWDNRVYMYSLQSGRELDRIFAHSDGISAMCVVKNRFLTSSWDSTVKLWRYTDKYLVASPIRTFLECEEAILCLGVSPDGDWAAAGARNGIVYLFNLQTVTFHREILVSPENRGDVASVVFARRSNEFVCMTLENELLQFNLHGEQMYKLAVHAAGQVRCFDSDGRFAVGGTTNGKIFFWKLNAAVGKELVYEIPRAHNTIICSLTIASDGSCVVSSAVDGSVRVWRLEHRSASSSNAADATAAIGSIQADPRQGTMAKHGTLRRRSRSPSQNQGPAYTFLSPMNARIEEIPFFWEC